MIKFENVTKTYGNFIAVDNVSFEIKDAEIFGFIGESGAGKSTILKLINRLESPENGVIVIDGQHSLELGSTAIQALRKSISVVFQSFNLLRNKTVFENVHLPLTLRNEKNAQRVEEVLRFVNLEYKMHRYPSALSGGEKQRVAIARSLITNPKILICDEATSALDPKTTQEILNVLKRINQEYQTTIVVVTHQLEVAKAICSRVAIMEKGSLIEIIDVNNSDTPPNTLSYTIHAKEVLTQ